MKDPIDRQAAVDVARKCIVKEVTPTCMLIDKAEIMTELMMLPSIQPDGIPLEWIDKHLEWLDNCDNGFAQLAKVGIKAMVEIWKKDKT